MTNKKTLDQRLKEARTPIERVFIMIEAMDEKSLKRAEKFMRCVILKEMPDNIETLADLKNYNKVRFKEIQKELPQAVIDKVMRLSDEQKRVCNVVFDCLLETHNGQQGASDAI